MRSLLEVEPLTPKVLHYCWFGGKPLPQKAQANVERWQELMPDYEIVRCMRLIVTCSEPRFFDKRVD